MTTETICNLYIRYSDGDSLHTPINPEMTDIEIRDYYFNAVFSRGFTDEDFGWMEYSRRVISLQITRITTVCDGIPRVTSTACFDRAGLNLDQALFNARHTINSLSAH